MKQREKKTEIWSELVYWNKKNNINRDCCHGVNHIKRIWYNDLILSGGYFLILIIFPSSRKRFMGPRVVFMLQRTINLICLKFESLYNGTQKRKFNNFSLFDLLELHLWEEVAVREFQIGLANLEKCALLLQEACMEFQAHFVEGVHSQNSIWITQLFKNWIQIRLFRFSSPDVLCLNLRRNSQLRTCKCHHDEVRCGEIARDGM